jgi:hypothetical protein
MPDAGDVQSCIDVLAAELCRPVVLVDRGGRVLGYSRHTGAIDRLRSEVILSRRFGVPASAGSAWLLRWFDPRRAASPVRVPAEADLGLFPRVVIAVRGGDAPLGYLSVLDAEGSLCQHVLDRVLWRVDELGAALRRERPSDVPAHTRDLAAVRGLLSGSAQHRVRAADDLNERRRFDPGCAVVAMVVVLTATGTTTAAERREAVEQCLGALRRTLPPRRGLHLTREDHGVLLVGVDPSDPDPVCELPQMAQRMVAAAARRLPRSPVLVGLGGVQPRLDQAAVSYTQARHAVTVAQVTTNHTPIASWDRLGIFRLLVDLPQRDVDTFAPQALRRLGDADDGTLLATLESYLDNAGHAQATANALCLHRATLYYRLERIRQVAGVDLNDGEARLELHVWLKLLRLRGGRVPRSRRVFDDGRVTIEAG